MADSFPVGDVGAVGDFPRFPLEPNWVSDPQTRLDLVRDLVAYRGTSHSLNSIVDDVPITFEARFSVYTLADYNTLLSTFVDARGRCNRFWIKHPYRSFKLKTNAASGAGVIYCYDNGFDQQYQGYERIYILMTTGDVVARHVTAATYNEAQSRLELSLNTILDRDITTTNHVLIGRYLLARLDSDEMELSVVTDYACETDLAFRELVKEYALI